MLIRYKTWNIIRGQFSSEEKAELNRHITGETICPPGISVDETKLNSALRDKLKDAISGAKG